MSFKDQLEIDVSNIFLNDSEFALSSTDVITNGVPAKGIFDLQQEFVREGDNFYKAASIWLQDSVVVLERYQEVTVKGVTWKMHQKIESDEYMTNYLLRSKEAHRFD